MYVLTSYLGIITVHAPLHAIWLYKDHPYKDQYWKFEKLRTTSTKLSEYKDQNFLNFKGLVAKVDRSQFFERKDPKDYLCA